ncbi:MAG: hypothetical protein ACI867_000058 [Glaciecola sp.]|jgi:hypothetical protein
MADPKPANGQKAFLKTEAGEQLHCLFNPEQLEIGLSTSWNGALIPGQQTPQLQFGGGESGTLKVELFFDSSADGKPVTNYTDKLVKLLKVDTTLAGYSEAKQNGRPPWVTFHWGKFHSFKSVLTNLDLKYIFFSSEGEPLRATANVSLKQFEQEDDWPRQNPTSGTPKPARSHQVRPGESLDRIAAHYYGDATEWRRLAQVNGIRDPFGLLAGMRIDVPMAED